MADPKIKYDIEANVKGDASVEALEQHLRALGQVLDGDLKTQANGAADALKNLGAKQEALATFRQLTNESKALTVELAQADGEVVRLARALPQAAAASSQFAIAEGAARAAVASTRADLDQQRQALVALREEFTGAGRRTDAYRESSAQLKITVASLRDSLKEKQAALQAATGQAATAATAEKKLSGEYSAAADSANKMRGAVLENSRALDTTKASLAAVGIGTNNLAQSERNLEAAVAQVRATVQGMGPAFAQAAAASNASTQRQISDQRTLKDGVRSVGDELRKIQAIAALAVGGGIFGSMIKDVAATADEFKNLSARVKLATGEGAAFDTAFEGVSEVALRTNSALNETGTLFVRIAQAGKDAGLSAQVAQQQALALTETINQAVQLSGSSAEASKAAVTQLIQGLQSGVLRGEEFNSVMEQAPRLAEALSQGLGVTTGELRKMAEQGALTSTTVIKALTDQSAAVASEFNKLPATVGRSLQNLSTQWTLYVGAADKGNGASASAAKIIDALAKNIDTLVNTLYAAGKAWAAIKIAGLAADLYKWATAAAGATVAVQSNTAATVANTAAQTSNAAAARASAAAHAVAGEGVAAGAAKAAAGGVVWRGVTALFGPLGVAVAVLGPELGNLGRWIGESAAKFMGYGKIMKDAEDATRRQEEATKANAAAQQLATIELEKARNKQFELSKEAAGLIAKFDEMRTKGDSAAEAIGKIGKDFDLASMPGIKDASGVLDKLAADGKLTAGQVRDAWAKALDGKDLAVFETTARAAFTGSAREAERLAQVFDATVREAVKRTGLDFGELQGKIGAASRSAINDVEQIVQGLVKLKAEGVDTGRVLTASISKAISTADSQKAIDDLKARIESLRKELGDKITDGLLDQATQKALDLGDALDKAKPGVNSLREAMSQLGITSDATFKETAEKSKAAYEVMRTSGLASARELAEGFKKTAEDAIAANKGIAPSWVAAEAAARGFEVQVDSAGKAILKAMGEGGAAVDGFTGRVQEGTKAIQDQLTWLERLQKRNAEVGQLPQAGRQGANGETLGEGVTEVGSNGNYRNREGFASDAKGNTISAGTDIGTLTGIAAFLKAAGVDNDAAARKIALEFADSKGDIPYLNNAGQVKYGGRSSTMSQALLKAAETYTFGSNGSNAQTPSTIPKQTTTVNINLNGNTQSINTDAAGASVLQDVLSQLAQARSTSSR